MKRLNVFFASVVIALTLAGSSFAANTNIAAIPTNAPMALEDVEKVIAQAVTRATQIPAIATNAFIAVVDREGFALGVWTTRGTNFAFTNVMDLLNVVDAITKAGTASFLSSDQHAFTSRTAGYIVQQHFPPGIRNKPTGPLVGVNFSNMTFSDVNRFKNPHTYTTGLFGGGGINGAAIAPDILAAISGLAGSPGGVPLFKNGKLIGGVGVAGTTHHGKTGIPALDDIQVAQKSDIDEDVALAGQVGFRPAERLLGSHVFIDGIRVPYVSSSTRLGPVLPFGTVGTNVPGYELTNSPLVCYPITNLNGITGELRAPIINDPEGRLSPEDVTSILSLAAKRASFTRAGIRLPRGVPMQIFIAVVNNPPPGESAQILGTFRTPEATLFSWDVAVQKARTAVYFSQTNRAFSSPALAFSSRTVGFLAQRAYPPGIAAGPPGPLLALQEIFSTLPQIDAFGPNFHVINVLNGVFLTNSFMVNSELTNGITIFPGGFPLYNKAGQLIGAVGVSGDGIDQDDLASSSGTVSNLPPQKIRADYNSFRGARLPYAKYPRNPSL
jgi:uncharacterized protein GlcG (DUF336 family)